MAVFDWTVPAKSSFPRGFTGLGLAELFETETLETVVGVAVAGTGVEVAGTGVEVAGTGVEVPGTGVEVAGTGVEVAGTGVFVGVDVAAGVPVGGDVVLVGTGVGVADFIEVR